MCALYSNSLPPQSIHLVIVLKHNCGILRVVWLLHWK